ncbi:hypothetical protein [Shewanella sedimentimangrovi]|uniref:Uncharacterized protein n=1 Tax=Shewanella sedimentimangrovi TaxID=2814293 RepID=A0ABX7R1G6_9GAMM|nr:hypothetical protein [Shewanella sedimentimangrovi]QSX36728.1 hypothetical protein JYB85_15840 [Shewanella sedimentimangrovi]
MKLFISLSGDTLIPLRWVPRMDAPMSWTHGGQMRRSELSHCRTRDTPQVLPWRLAGDVPVADGRWCGSAAIGVPLQQTLDHQNSNKYEEVWLLHHNSPLWSRRGCWVRNGDN